MMRLVLAEDDYLVREGTRRLLEDSGRVIDDESYAFNLFHNGIDGLAYLLKDRVTDLDELLRAIDAVQHGWRSRSDGRGQDQQFDRERALSLRIGGREARERDFFEAGP